MEKPLISFIVTCYNLPHEMIRECVDSILSLRLTAEEREIIVILPSHASTTYKTTSFISGRPTKG